MRLFNKLPVWTKRVKQPALFGKKNEGGLMPKTAPGTVLL
jgi:hypothetical protein